MMLFLAVVRCLQYAGHFLTLYLLPQFLLLNILLELGLSSLAEGVFLNGGFFFATPIPRKAESFAMSLSCISVASADRTISIAFSRVRSEILSNLSLVLVSLMPITILSLIREFSNALNSRLTQLSQHSNILINGFATFLGPWKEVFSRFTVFLEFL